MPAQTRRTPARRSRSVPPVHGDRPGALVVEGVRQRVGERRDSGRVDACHQQRVAVIEDLARDRDQILRRLGRAEHDLRKAAAKRAVVVEMGHRRALDPLIEARSAGQHANELVARGGGIDLAHRDPAKQLIERGSVHGRAHLSERERTVKRSARPGWRILRRVDNGRVRASDPKPSRSSGDPDTTNGRASAGERTRPQGRTDGVDVRPQFFNRELSLLEFNRRVLAQAKDTTLPLLERLRFLTICTSNLDEFFEVRVAGLKQQIRYGATPPGVDGLPAREVLRRVTQVAHGLVREQYRVANDEILPRSRRRRSASCAAVIGPRPSSAGRASTFSTRSSLC